MPPSFDNFEPVDVLAELEALRQDTALNYIDLHGQVGRVLHKMRDCHTNYIAPTRQLLADHFFPDAESQPLVFVPLAIEPAAADLNNFVVRKVSADELPDYAELIAAYAADIDTDGLLAAMGDGTYELVSVDGADPYDFVVASGPVGKVSANAAAYSLLKYAGGTLVDPLHSMYPLTTDAELCVVYEDGGEQTMCLPWAVGAQTTSSGATAQMGARALLARAKQRRDGDSTLSFEQILSEDEGAAVTCGRFEGSVDGYDAFLPIGYIKSTNFLAAYADWISDLSTCATAFAEEPAVQSYIFDLRSNTGGKALNAVYLSRLISGNRMAPNMDLIALHRHDKWEQKEQIRNYALENSVDPLTRVRTTVDPLATRLALTVLEDGTNDALTTYFTRVQRTGLPSDSEWSQWSGADVVNLPTSATSENTLILTDGLCMSAGAMFARRAVAQGYARAVSVLGSADDRPLGDIGMGAGCNIFAYADFTDCAADASCEPPLVYGAEMSTPTHAFFSITDREDLSVSMFGSNAAGGDLVYTPVQFVAADLDVFFAEGAAPATYVEQLLPLLGFGTDGNAQRGSFLLDGCNGPDSDNGPRYGRRWDEAAGSWLDECEIFDCDPGYGVLDSACVIVSIPDTTSSVRLTVFICALLIALVLGSLVTGIVVFFSMKRRAESVPEEPLIASAHAIASSADEGYVGAHEA